MLLFPEWSEVPLSPVNLSEKVDHLAGPTPDVSCSWKNSSDSFCSCSLFIAQDLFTYPAAWRIRPPRPGWCAHVAAPGKMLPWRGCSGCHRSPRPATRTLRQTEPAPRPAGASLLACSHSDRSSLEAPGQFSLTETRRGVERMGWLSSNGRKVGRLDDLKALTSEGLLQNPNFWNMKSAFTKVLLHLKCLVTFTWVFMLTSSNRGKNCSLLFTPLHLCDGWSYFTLLQSH